MSESNLSFRPLNVSCYISIYFEVCPNSPKTSRKNLQTLHLKYLIHRSLDTFYLKFDATNLIMLPFDYGHRFILLNFSCCFLLSGNVGHLGFIPGLGRFPWRRAWLPTPVFWPGEFHGSVVYGVAKSWT